LAKSKLFASVDRETNRRAARCVTRGSLFLWTGGGDRLANLAVFGAA
jgi:hypothetical protein